MTKAIFTLAAAILVAAGTAVYALAGHQQGSVLSITGCLTGTGKLVKFKVGDVPKQPCAGATQVHLSGGDITAVLPSVDGGLAGGGTNGEALLGLEEGFKLPQGCGPDNVPKSFGAGKWICGVAALGNQACPAGAIVTGIDAAGKLVCGREIRSVNGLVRMAVLDVGVLLDGPDNSVLQLTENGLIVDTHGDISIDANQHGGIFLDSRGTILGASSRPAVIHGSSLNLGGSSCPVGAARRGDPVVVNPQNGVGSIVAGSTKVFAC